MKSLTPYIISALMMVQLTCTQGERDNASKDVSGDGLAEIQFVKTEHDLGKILQGETVGYNFEFSNAGESALLILEARAGCGCTVPRYSKKPVHPGESGTIEVVFDSSGRMGKQLKTVTLRTNSIEPTVKLTITADIVKQDS